MNTEREHQDLQRSIDYSFRDPRHLQEALTHSSFTHENPDEEGQHNERLEFLGDAVLGLAAASFLLASFPGSREGELSRLRASLVGQRPLAELARSLSIGSALRLGRGEDRSGGRGKDSILAGAAEAIMGALYVDGGWEAAYGFAERYLRQRLAYGGGLHPGADPKTRLQELCQQQACITPTYRLLEQSGPPHKPRFTVAVFLEDRELARGDGSSKKEAEQEAAAAAASVLQGEDGEDQ